MESIRWSATSTLRSLWQRKTRYRPGRRRPAALRGATSAGRLLLVSEASLAALFHFLSKLPHGLLRDGSSLATCERSFGVVKGGQKFRPLALAFFPQGQRFPHSVFLTAKPARFDGLADKRFLVGGSNVFPSFKGKSEKRGCQARH
jgi:hypothetical protein